MQQLNSLLDLFLKNFVAANPAKSMYGFTLNRKRPGHFSLCFLANKNATVQTWVHTPNSLSWNATDLIVSLSVLHRKHIIYSMPLQSESLNFATLSKLGKLKASFSYFLDNN